MAWMVDVHCIDGRSLQWASWSISNSYSLTDNFVDKLCFAVQYIKQHLKQYFEIRSSFFIVIDLNLKNKCNVFGCNFFLNVTFFVSFSIENQILLFLIH